MKRAYAQISFGLIVDTVPLQGDGIHTLDDWWRKVNGYEPLFQLQDEEGNYHPSIELDDHGQPKDKAREEAWWQHQRDWDEANPCPVRWCSYGYSDQDEDECLIVAVPTTVLTVDIDDATIVMNPTRLTVSQAEIDGLKAFCARYLPTECLEPGAEPQWRLSCGEG